MRRRAIIAVCSAVALWAWASTSHATVFRGATEGTGAPTTTCTVALPTGTQPGDLLLAITIADQTTQTLTPPAGFTVLRERHWTSDGGNPLHAWVTWKTATGADTGPFVWTVTTAGRVSCSLAAYGDVDGTTPIADASTDPANNTNDTALKSPSMTTPAPTGLLMVGVVLTNPLPTWTPPTTPAPWTEDVEHATNRQGRYFAHLDWSGTGATGVLIGTLSASISQANKHAWTIVLTPVGGAPPASATKRRWRHP